MWIGVAVGIESPDDVLVDGRFEYLPLEFINSVIQDLEIKCPSKEEQSMISSVFKTIDSLITLHQRKQTINFRPFPT